MEQLIEEVISSVFEKFSSYVDGKEGVCIFKELAFNDGNFPDYSKEELQLAYFLKYFPAYFAEYFVTYNKLFSHYGYNNEPLRVLSIGCGCGLDYYGLEFALREKSTSCREKVFYTGIDIVNWSYRDKFANENVEYIDEGFTVIDDFGSIQDGDTDIIIFPKSLGDLSASSEVYDELLNKFKNSEFTQNRLYIISSARKEHLDIDRECLKEILEIMEDKHNYSLDKEDKRACLSPRENAGIRRFVPGFIYPDAIKSYLDSLEVKCPTFINESSYCHDDCLRKLSRQSPITRTDHIRTQIFRLSKIEALQ